MVTETEARETLLITRKTSERLFDFSFRLAQRRKARGAPGRLACVDKANAFKAYAFFRKIFDECAARYPGVDTDRIYVDAWPRSQSKIDASPLRVTHGRPLRLTHF